MRPDDCATEQRRSRKLFLSRGERIGEGFPQAAELGVAHPIARAIDWVFAGWLPKAYYYFEIAMGWLLVSIVIAGFSGLLGHAREE